MNYAELGGVNVAPSSSNGHFVLAPSKEKKVSVIQLDETTESFFVNGSSELKTHNHTTLQHEKSTLILTQFVYNPIAKAMERSMD